MDLGTFGLQQTRYVSEGKSFGQKMFVSKTNIILIFYTRVVPALHAIEDSSLIDEFTKTFN